MPPRAVMRRADLRLVLALSGTTILLWIGGSALVPLLPVYLAAHGSSPVLVGGAMAAYFAASVLTQFPAGRLTDRIGSAPVIVVGLSTFALGSLGFALIAGPAASICSRALQGAGAGAVLVAAAAMIGRRVSEDARGRAFGLLYGSQMFALAIGPLLGTVFGLGAMRGLFFAAAVVALAALAPILVVARRADREVVVDGAHSTRSHAPLRLSREIVGVALVFATTGVLGGVYETCWTLLLHLRGATPLEIGFSWTTFALPFALLSLPAGRLAERYDRRVLVYAAVISSAGFAIAYPYVHVVALLVGLGVFEATGAVIGAPAATLVLSTSAAPGEQGRAQGVVETARTAATAAGAAAGGALFAVATALPFVLAGVVTIVLIGATAWCWRGLPGHLGESRSGGVSEAVATPS